MLCRNPFLLFAGACVASCILAARAAEPGAATPRGGDVPNYHIYAGSTHAHTSFTWSHGEQWVNVKPAAGKKKEPLIYVDAEGAQHPSKAAVMKEGWEKVQGPPARHFAAAKEKGYDFYITTDHSQEADFQPPSATNANWVTTLKAAADASDANFVAIAGYEHSENNGPEGQGHLNVINSAEYLSALMNPS